MHIGDASLSIGPIGRTMMLCPPEVMEVEERLMEALEAAQGWRMEGALLVLTGADGEALARARARQEAATITITVPGAEEVTRTTVDYRCGEETVTVEYVNAGNVSLAILTIEEQPIVAANVVAASGARYAGDRFVWWSRGRGEALLQDETADSPPLDCVVAD